MPNDFDSAYSALPGKDKIGIVKGKIKKIYQEMAAEKLEKQKEQKEKMAEK